MRFILLVSMEPNQGGGHAPKAREEKFDTCKVDSGWETVLEKLSQLRV